MKTNAKTLYLTGILVIVVLFITTVFKSVPVPTKLSTGALTSSESVDVFEWRCTNRNNDNHSQPIHSNWHLKLYPDDTGKIVTKEDTIGTSLSEHGKTRNSNTGLVQIFKSDSSEVEFHLHANEKGEYYPTGKKSHMTPPTSTFRCRAV